MASSGGEPDRGNLQEHEGRNIEQAWETMNTRTHQGQGLRSGIPGYQATSGGSVSCGNSGHIFLKVRLLCSILRAAPTSMSCKREMCSYQDPYAAVVSGHQLCAS